MESLRIRAARPDEEATLTALCLRSKAHWGYDAAFLDASRTALAIDAAMIPRTLVAETETGIVCGIAAAEPLDGEGTFDLARLFVEPRAIGGHVGSALFAAVVERIRAEGAKRLMILADPHATGFYERLGAVRIGEAPSESIPGRSLPLFAYRIV